MSKEWNGNSRSASYALVINKGYNTKDREQDDYYATDPEALVLLLDKCSSFLNGVMQGNISTYPQGEYHIWECACGSGNLSKVLQDRGFEVLSTDLKDRGFGRSGIDFLSINRQHIASVILTNPPYSLATEFAEHAMELLPENGLYVALMNVNALSGIHRYKRLYNYGILRDIYIYSRRVNCYKNNKQEQAKGMCNYAWFVFQKGYVGQPTLYWL